MTPRALFRSSLARALRRALGVVLLAGLAACAEAPRYVVEAPAPERALRLPVATVVLRDLELPGHASAAEVLLRDETGALEPLGDAIWADDPVRAHTATLARALDAGGTATVATEPWPLQEPAQAELTVRIDRMLGRADGTFALDAQVAVRAPDGALRERIERFSITTALPQADAAGVAQASGAALRLLADRILSMLAN
jgi:uncharacterized lipoprotein YmbA